MSQRWKLHLLVVATVGLAFPGSSGSSHHKWYTQSLVPERLTFQWRVDYDIQTIHALVTYQSLEEKSYGENVDWVSKKYLSAQSSLYSSDWVAVGFSDRGESVNADFCVFWVDWKGNPYVRVRAFQSFETVFPLLILAPQTGCLYPREQHKAHNGWYPRMYWLRCRCPV